LKVLEWKEYLRVSGKSILEYLRVTVIEKTEGAPSQKQYLIQYKPLVVERWALPTIEKARDIQTTSITSIPRSCYGKSI